MNDPTYTRRRFVRVESTLGLAGLLGAAIAQAQPSISCDTASFARLGLPATRIVSATPVTDDPRAGAHCVAARRRQRAHGHGRQALRDRFRDALAATLERPLLSPG